MLFYVLHFYSAISAKAPEPAPAPQPAVVPAQQQTVAQQQTATPQNNANSGDKIVNIGGKNYLIHDGKAYPIQ